MQNQNNVIPYQYNINLKFFRVFLRRRHPVKLHNLYLCFTEKARTQSTAIFIDGGSNSRFPATLVHARALLSIEKIS